MSEHRPLQTDPGGNWESRLRAGLHDLETAPAGLPGADRVRHTHLRRRTALTAASALAAVVVAGGTVLALTGPSTSAPVAPTTTEPAPTATAAPTPSTTSPAPDPSTTTQTTPASGVPTTIPAGFVLYDTEPSHDADVTDFTETGPIPLAPCDHTPDPRTEVVPTDSRAIWQTGPEFMLRIQLEVFEDAGAAAGWVSGHQDIATECIGQPSTEGETTVVENLSGSWGQGVTWVDGYRTQDGIDPGTFGPGGTYTLMMRVGSAVATVQGYGEHAPALDRADPDVVAGYRLPLDQLAPKLCLFTEAGC